MSTFKIGKVGTGNDWKLLATQDNGAKLVLVVEGKSFTVGEFDHDSFLGNVLSSSVRKSTGHELQWTYGIFLINSDRFDLYERMNFNIGSVSLNPFAQDYYEAEKQRMLKNSFAQ